MVDIDEQLAISDTLTDSAESLEAGGVGAGPAMARRSKRTRTPGLTSRVAIWPSSALIRPIMPEVVVISSPTPRLDWIAWATFARRRWEKNMNPINSTGNAKISRLLDPPLGDPAATSEDISWSFMKSWPGIHGTEWTRKSTSARC